MNATEHIIRIDAAGAVSAIYADELAGILEALGGRLDLRRASHVEPVTDPRCGAIGWTADMAPSSGPILGPYPTRAEALDAERAWITGRLRGAARRRDY